MPANPATSPVPNPAAITQLLERCAAGDLAARGEVFDAIYNDLRIAARARLARPENAGQSIQPTELVNEACLRLLRPMELKGMAFQNRRHLYGSAARAMMQVLVNRARDKGAGVRTAEGVRIDLDETNTAPNGKDLDVLALALALEALEKLDADLTEAFYLRALAGLTYSELGDLLGVGHKTAERRYQTACDELRRSMREPT